MPLRAWETWPSQRARSVASIRHLDRRFTLLDMPNDTREWIALLDDPPRDRSGLRCIAGDQQAARGLRVGIEMSPPLRKIRIEPDAVAITRPVAHRGAGEEPLPDQL